MPTQKLIEKFNKKVEELQKIMDKKDKSIKVYLHQLINRCSTDEVMKKMLKDIEETKTTLKED
ncbi:MAG: hypothetical protein ACOCRX_10520 [Candidatus Woesearchaeota archaeon]